MEYVQLFAKESTGSMGSFGLKILISVGRDPTEADTTAAYRAADQLEDDLLRETVRLDPDKQALAARQRTELLELFPSSIFVEAIPNGYCHRACCSHLPWFIVTTPVGRIKIGWRKRVINIDWSESKIGFTADHLFPQETQTTRGEGYIHAWGLEKAKQYIDVLLEQ